MSPVNTPTSEAIMNRLKHPVLGPFTLIWCFYNWEIVLTLTLGQSSRFRSRYEAIESMLVHDSFWINIRQHFLPVVALTVGYVIFVPILDNVYFRYTSWFEIQKERNRFWDELWLAHEKSYGNKLPAICGALIFRIEEIIKWIKAEDLNASRKMYLKDTQSDLMSYSLLKSDATDRTRVAEQIAFADQTRPKAPRRRFMFFSS